MKGITLTVSIKRSKKSKALRIGSSSEVKTVGVTRESLKHYLNYTNLSPLKGRLDTS